MRKLIVLGIAFLVAGAGFNEANAQRGGFNRADFKIRGRFANINPPRQTPQYYAPATSVPSTGQSYRSFSYEPGAAPAPVYRHPVAPYYAAPQRGSCCTPWPYYFRPFWK